MPIIEKIGFIVHEPTMWAHYSSVWKIMDHNQFSIIVTDRFREKSPPGKSLPTEAFLETVTALGYDFVFASDLVTNKIKYKYIVSNHYISGSSTQKLPWFRSAYMRTKQYLQRTAKTLRSKPPLPSSGPFDLQQYLPLQLGVKQIRFMYGADIGDGWSLAEWNNIYDLFLCHGPNDQKELNKKFHGKTQQIGYPRYDDYFNISKNSADIIDEFSIDPSKKTILWMPTFGDGACSIPYFAEKIASYGDKYNVIVRPHPISFSEKKSDIELLVSHNYKIDRDALRDMNALYKITDIVLCDYGGSPFGALYLNKRFVLLEVAGSKDWFTVKGTTNLELAECFPVLNIDTVEQLDSIILDDDYWQSRENIMSALRKKYFADLAGRSAARAAEILSRPDDYL